MQESIPFKVSTTKLFLQDEFINLDDITELEDDSIFKMEQMPKQPYEFDEFIQMSISVEMNLDQKVIARAGYTFVDYLSDIGGFQGLLISGVGYLLAAWNYNQFDNHMVTRLYKMEKEGVDKQLKIEKKTFFDRSSAVKPSFLANPKEYICDEIPDVLKMCGCLRPNRKERFFKVARDRFAHESNIIEIIKSRRYTSQALQLLLSKRQRLNLKLTSRYLNVNPDASDSAEDKQQPNNDRELDEFYSSSGDDTIDLLPLSSDSEEAVIA